MAANKQGSKRTSTGKPSRDAKKRRPNPKAAKLLLPVWGYRHVRQFLETSLPTLLAPGNIPSLARSLPCEFVILTSAEDEAYIQEHPLFRQLKDVCSAKTRRIDHLITGSNYSTTITLSYTEEIRAAGVAMTDTCFFFLVSDYIMADGSLANVLKYMQKGESAVQVGNFQVILEDALAWIQEKQRKSGKLALAPRVLMSWALGHIHPTTTANMVNFPFTHNSHTNRLFWRVDADTLIGRFYLMHMICVRPEVTEFVIGASCDYSFVPELCPSGKVAVINDSDDYLVIEMQPRDHESAFLQPGPIKPNELAKSLSEWTTTHHRENVNHSIIYHAEDLPDELSATVDEAGAFVDKVRRAMTRKPQPFRGHPYWRGAVAAFREATGKRLGEDEWHLVLGSPGRHGRFLDNIRFAIFGRPPNVKPWHPNWPDYRLPLQALTGFFSDPQHRLLIISDVPTAFTVALADNGERVVRKQLAPFLRSLPDRYRPFRNHFNLCLLELTEHDLNEADEIVERVAELVKPDGSIFVSIMNKRPIGEAGEFVKSIAYHMPRLVRPSVWPREIRFVPAGDLRIAAQSLLVRLAKFAYRFPWFGIPPLAVFGPFLTLLNFGGNLFAANVKKEIPRRGAFSSGLIHLRLDRGTSGQKADSPAKGSKSNPELYSTGTATCEPQYGRCIEVKNEVGLTPLGLMTNQVWHDDPRRLCFLLARYKFVSKMLSGRHDVGELGCGDAFGSRIVLQEVGKLSVYDFDPVFIDDVNARASEDWPLEAHIHDIVSAPLPSRHDGIYSLDVIEHISREDEDAYLSNLRSSLTDDGILIIGTPSLESQPYASPLSKAGHVNCKSGKELKALMEQYFTAVSVFSMNDEVVHTGFYPMAHYLFALCTGKPERENSAIGGRD